MSRNQSPFILTRMIRKFEKSWNSSRTLANLAYIAILKNCLQTALNIRDVRLGGQTMIVYVETDHDILVSITVEIISRERTIFRLKSDFICLYPNLYTIFKSIRMMDS